MVKENKIVKKYIYEKFYIQLMYRKEVAICTMTSLGGGDQEVERCGSDIKFIMTGGRDRLEAGPNPVAAQYSLSMAGSRLHPVPPKAGGQSAVECGQEKKFRVKCSRGIASALRSLRYLNKRTGGRVVWRGAVQRDSSI